jgi:hypothetical protein
VDPNTLLGDVADRPTTGRVYGNLGALAALTRRGATLYLTLAVPLWPSALTTVAV